VHYQSQSLSTEDGYGAFLQERYGASPVLTGTGFSGFFRGADSAFGLGVELSSLESDINYKTLNGEEQTNSLRLQSSILLATYTVESWELGAGLGTNELTRTFNGYQDVNIVTDNIGDQEGTVEVTTAGTVTALQLLYRWGLGKLSVDGGLRYTASEHEIPATDARPAYSSLGVPEAQTFNLGGMGFLLSLTYQL
jgi:hypothetical protein